MTAIATPPAATNLPPLADSPTEKAVRQPAPTGKPESIDLNSLERELDALRARIHAELGDEDVAYLRRSIALQRWLEIGGRASLMFAVFPPAWIASVAMLSLSKIISNMELGHNIIHGQWDWLNDDAVHSTTWEWDNVCTSEDWSHSHNEMHHQWTNVDGVDLDVGYGILRVHPEQKWHPAALAQPVYFTLLALLFEWGVGIHDLDYDVVAMRKAEKGSDEFEAAKASLLTKLKGFRQKVRKQVTKDYVLSPLLGLPFGLPGVLAAASAVMVANVIRNVWAFAVIFCGHFPDGAQYFTPEEVENESRGGWYRRQILGSANFTGGPIMRFMSGNLCHQIEHHLFPDTPSNRYEEMSAEVREICERHGLAYNTGSFTRQLGTVVRKVLRLSFPGGASQAAA